MKLVKSVRKGLGERDSSGNLLVTIREGKKDRMDQGRYFLILWLGTVILSGWMGYLGGLEYEKTVCFGALFLLAAFLEFLLPEFPIFNQITYKSILYLGLGLCPLAAFLLPPVQGMIRPSAVFPIWAALASSKSICIARANFSLTRITTFSKVTGRAVFALTLTL